MNRLPFKEISYNQNAPFFVSSKNVERTEVAFKEESHVKFAQGEVPVLPLKKDSNDQWIMDNATTAIPQYKQEAPPQQKFSFSEVKQPQRQPPQDNPLLVGSMESWDQGLQSILCEKEDPEVNSRVQTLKRMSREL